MTEEQHELSDTSRTETTVRQYDDANRLLSEVVTTVVRRHPPDDELPVGMYL